MPIQPKKVEELEKKMHTLGIKEEDLLEKFILGSGRGGQKIQKTSSCVYLKHLPTGLEVKCQEERSRETNRYLARRKLCELIEEQLLGKKSAKQQEIHKIRAQKKRRSRRTKEKLLEEKRLTTEKKDLRKIFSSQDENC